MNYRQYLMQMAQQGKVIKTGGTLRIIHKQPYYKRTYSGSTGVYSGGTVKKLILDRLDNGIEPLTTSVSTLTIGKKYRKKASKRKASKGGSLNPAADFIKAIVKGSKKLSKKKSSKRKSSKRKASKRKSSKRKASKRKASKRKASTKTGGRVARKKRSIKALKFKM